MEQNESTVKKPYVTEVNNWHLCYHDFLKAPEKIRVTHSETLLSLETTKRYFPQFMDKGD